MSIFLDVDNLQEFGHLAEEIAASDVVLLFLSRGYFASKACAIEYEAAVRLGKPLILVHEGNENKGGLPLEQARRDCPEPLRQKQSSAADPSSRGSAPTPSSRLPSSGLSPKFSSRAVATSRDPSHAAICTPPPPLTAALPLPLLARRVFLPGSLSHGVCPSR